MQLLHCIAVYVMCTVWYYGIYYDHSGFWPHTSDSEDVQSGKRGKGKNRQLFRKNMEYKVIKLLVSVFVCYSPHILTTTTRRRNIKPRGALSSMF